VSQHAGNCSGRRLLGYGVAGFTGCWLRGCWVTGLLGYRVALLVDLVLLTRGTGKSDRGTGATARTERPTAWATSDSPRAGRPTARPDVRRAGRRPKRGPDVRQRGGRPTARADVRQRGPDVRQCGPVRRDVRRCGPNVRRRGPTPTARAELRGAAERPTAPTSGAERPTARAERPTARADVDSAGRTSTARAGRPTARADVHGAGRRSDTGARDVRRCGPGRPQPVGQRHMAGQRPQ